MGYSLDLLKQIAHGLAQQFGDSCEIVIHDVRHGIENTILYIENGHVTDRKSGDSASNVVLEAIKADPSTLQDQYAYLTKTNDGRLLKSSTFYIKDESGTLAYIFSPSENRMRIRSSTPGAPFGQAVKSCAPACFSFPK